MQRAKVKAIRKACQEAQGNKCCYCETELTQPRSNAPTRPTDATLEHLERVADGGGDNLGNFATACRKCNLGRGLMDWLTYKTYRMGELYLDNQFYMLIVKNRSTKGEDHGISI